MSLHLLALLYWNCDEETNFIRLDVCCSEARVKCFSRDRELFLPFYYVLSTCFLSHTGDFVILWSRKGDT